MPKIPRYFTESVTVTPKNIPATARDYARASCTKYFMERVDGMQSLEVPIQRDVFSEEKNTYWYGSVVQRASRGCSTNGSTLDIRRSLDRDPQPVQQDQQDHYPGIEVMTPLETFTTQRQVSALPSYLNMWFHNDLRPRIHYYQTLNDSVILAPLDADHSTFHIQLQTRTRKIIIELHGWAPACNAMSRNVVDIFQNGWIQGIQSSISFKPVQSHVLHRLTSRRLTLYDFNVISIPSKDSRELAKDREAVSLNDITHQSRHQQCGKSRRRAESNGGAHCDSCGCKKFVHRAHDETHTSPENLRYDGQSDSSADVYQTRPE
ncbi:hypothetical protein EV424DRAFT_1584308 [Suillus variegatus]|nr:hypothetical protein EV424DRAFT_1354282 [Suillus variegatus]KAG1803013.1 hypothetical protein EV424DRAFT_1584308 [Suillus variegatus]